MDIQALVATRRALHGVAELVIAGPQYAATGTIRLLVSGKGLRHSAEVVASAQPVVLHCDFEEV